ncbi:hypothetical protein [Pseudaminobacter sp. NGMCC 1.201702]|uniref:hypothetical protein n=1 Tax=Pseudaminobacter sp. NGMCC 1.201702 TaxID=3391825 RepID=UPI0039F0F05B
MIDRDPRIDAIAASDLASAATIASLISALASKGVLTNQETREIYENALALLESHQGDEPEMQPVFDAAREIIEAQLR